MICNSNQQLLKHIAFFASILNDLTITLSKHTDKTSFGHMRSKSLQGQSRISVNFQVQKIQSFTFNKSQSYFLHILIQSTLILLVACLIFALPSAAVAYNDGAITPDVQAVTLEILKTSYIYNALNYSLSNEWQMKWYGTNPYKSDWLYGMQQVAEQYSPKELIQMDWYSPNLVVGDGFSNQEKSIIANIISTKPDTEEMAKLLNSKIKKTNWNIYARSFTYSTRFSIHARDDRWFSYSQNVVYFVYAS